HVLQTMPATTEIERRDRALIAFAILARARDGAIASFKLKHIDIDQGRVDQDAREVKTKFSKSFEPWFFPVDTDISNIVIDWFTYWRKIKLWVRRSLRLDVGAAEHVGPLLGISCDELAEVGRRARQHRAAQVGNARLHLGIGERHIDLLVELV